MRGRGGAVLTLAWLLAGCAGGVRSPAEEAMALWKGRPVAEVVASWGEPEVIVDRPEGRTYIYEATHYSRRYYPANLEPSGGGPYTAEGLPCRGVLEVNPEGIVTRAEWVGEECRRR